MQRVRNPFRGCGTAPARDGRPKSPGNSFRRNQRTGGVVQGDIISIRNPGKRVESRRNRVGSLGSTRHDRKQLFIARCNGLKFLHTRGGRDEDDTRNLRACAESIERLRENRTPRKIRRELVEPHPAAGARRDDNGEKTRIHGPGSSRIPESGRSLAMPPITG